MAVRFPVALKEWAAVVESLRMGESLILLRKGGLYETPDVFDDPHRRFLFYPTAFHQAPAALNAVGQRAQSRVVAQPPVTFAVAGEIVADWWVADRGRLRSLPEHALSESTLDSRFAYRNPGLHVLLIRAWILAKPVMHPEHPSYAGCVSWVDLREVISVDEVLPAVAADEFEARAESVRSVLGSAG